MSGTLSHEPADIIRQLIIGLALGTDPDDDGDWPVYWSNEPDSPDSCLTVYDTEAQKDGRTQVDGQTQVHYGFQVRIRANSPTVGATKGRDILESFDTVLRTSVVLGDYTYTVQAISRVGDLVSLGRDAPNSQRRIFTLNAITDIFLASSVGTGT